MIKEESVNHILNYPSTFQGREGFLKQIMRSMKLKKIQREIHDKGIEASYQMEKGVNYALTGNYDKAATSYFIALANYEAVKDSLGIGKSYLNIGNVYFLMEKENDALVYYQKALMVYKQLKNEKSMARALGNIGAIYRDRKPYQKALEYLNESLAINQKLKQHEDARIDLQNIGTVYFKLEDHSNALKYFNQALELSKSLGSKRGQILANHSIAVIESRLGNYIKANKILDEALQMAISNKMKKEIVKIYKSLAVNYEDMGQYKKALGYRIKYETWKDSILNADYQDKLHELVIKYETAKKNEEIALLTKEKEIQEVRAQRQSIFNKALIGIIVLIGIITGLLIYTQRQRLKNQRILINKDNEIRETQFKHQLGELEMKALRAQMNPHFVFNCLNSINRMILSDESENASAYLTRFSRLIRKVLENSEQSMVALSDELSLLETYIELESLRFKGKINYRSNIDNGIDPDEIYIPSMVLQPLVENAIWHGLMHKIEGGTITISVKREGDLLKCSVEDDGVGRNNEIPVSENSEVKKKSFGLQITQERLRLMNNKDMQRLIHIEDLKDRNNKAIGTRVDLLIPVANYDKVSNY
jgi:tetratricopeptide (TPR) repeat protein